jgi:tRNA(adenine34) deaminase
MTMISDRESEQVWMELALQEARQAVVEGEVPIGAVGIYEGKLLARDHNRSIQLRDPSAHAEILVLRAAGRFLGNYRLPGLELYTTVEPCCMCAGALVWARIKKLTFGVRDEKAGGVVSRAELLTPGLLNHDIPYSEGILADQCRDVLRRFFAARRGS